MIAFTDVRREVYAVEPTCKVMPTALSTSRMCRANPPDLRPQGARHAEAPCTRIRRVSDENEQAYSAQGLARSVASVRRVGSPASPGAAGVGLQRQRAGWPGTELALGFRPRSKDICAYRRSPLWAAPEDESFSAASFDALGRSSGDK